MEKYYNLKVMNSNILWYTVYDTKTIVAHWIIIWLYFMYHIENMLMADHLDKHHVLCPQNPFVCNNVTLQ